MELEQELRRVLHAHDVPLPVDDPVPAVRAGMRRRRRVQQVQVGAAAAAVVAVVAGVALLVGSPAGAPAPSVPATATPSPPAPVDLSGFRASDVSAAGGTLWALGTRPCDQGACTTQVVSTDGGATWSVRAARGLPLTCGDVCVHHVRFADEKVGYAFGPSLFITLNGGESWSRMAASEVVALEVADGTVTRVVPTQPGCAPGCAYLLQTSPVASLAWTTAHRTSGAGVDAVLAAVGRRVTAGVLGHRAGGSLDARTRLSLSTDAGRTWSDQDDPCSPGFTPSAAEHDTMAVGLGPEGQSVVACQDRQADAPEPVAVRFSADSGRTYAGARPVGLDAATSVVALGGDEALVSGTRGDRQLLLRTSDGGRTWTEAAATDGSSGTDVLSFDGAVGTWLPAGGSAVWVSTDSGRSWEQQPFA